MKGFQQWSCVQYEQEAHTGWKNSKKKKKKKISSIRNLKLKKSDIFYSLLKDLSNFLIAGLQTWFSLVKSMFKTPLEEVSC